MRTLHGEGVLVSWSLSRERLYWLQVDITIILKNMYDILFLIGRILFGGYFLVSGIGHLTGTKGLSEYAASKKVPFPVLSVIVTGLVLVLGGLGIVLDVYRDISLILISLFLLVVSFMMHGFWNIKDPKERALEKISFYKNIALLGAALMFFSLGGF